MNQFYGFENGNFFNDIDDMVEKHMSDNFKSIYSSEKNAEQLLFGDPPSDYVEYDAHRTFVSW